MTRPVVEGACPNCVGWWYHTRRSGVGYCGHRRVLWREVRGAIRTLPEATPADYRDALVHESKSVGSEITR